MKKRLLSIISIIAIICVSLLVCACNSVTTTAHKHNYVAKFEWVNSSEAWVTITCSTDGTHTSGRRRATISSSTTATCTESGIRTYVASYEYDYQKFTDEKEVQENALGHNIEKIMATTATCETDGCNAHYECERCQKAFADANGTQELQKDDYVILKIGHKYAFSRFVWASDYSSAKAIFVCRNDNSHEDKKDASVTFVTDATCTTAGEKMFTAKVEFGGQTYTDQKSIQVEVSHDLVKTDYKEPTCSTQGNSEYYACSDCGKYFSDLAGSSEITKDSWILEKVAHSYTIEGVCKWCNAEAETSYTGNKTPVFDDLAGKYISSTKAYDEDGNEYDRYLLTPTALMHSFTVSGTITNGQIYISDSAETYSADITLKGASITCLYDSPIYAMNADKVEIAANLNTTNYVYDSRAQIVSETTVTNTLIGLGAIYAKCDLEIKGNGTLYVEGGYNNGIHTTKDLKVKNLTLNVEAYNNGLKGNDSLTIESGDIKVVSTAGDGLKTSNSDLSTLGKQRGTITILGGSIKVYACFDGIDASYDVVIGYASSAKPTTATDINLEIYTWTYAYEKESLIDKSLNSYGSGSSSSSSSTSNNRPGGGPGGQQGGGMQAGNSLQTTYSCKGIKSSNILTINDGTIVIYSVDDGLHVSNSDILQNTAITPVGDLTIYGGDVTITTQDDGIHADNILSISGGRVNILNAYEGIEGEYINISGGDIDVYSTDDGLNASKDDETPKIIVSGGDLYLYVSGGDVDGIDSNGQYEQTGGVVVVCCFSGLDVDSSATISGGTLIHAKVGNNGMASTTPSTSLKSKTISSSLSSGDYTLISGSTTLLSFKLGATASSLTIYSDKLTSGSSYTLSKGGSTISSWRQS